MTNHNLNFLNCDSSSSIESHSSGFSNIDMNAGIYEQRKVVGSGRFHVAANSDNRCAGEPNRSLTSRTVLESIIQQLNDQKRTYEMPSMRDPGSTYNNLGNGSIRTENPAKFYEEAASLFNRGVKNQNPIESVPVQVHNEFSVSDLTLLLNQIQLQDRLSSAPGSNQPSARISPTSYVCHICNKPGHTIKECPGVRPRTQCYTPYQGTKRCFGEFKCERCDRTWMSGNSWANESQLCKKCSHPCFPFRQASLNKPDGLDRSDQSRVHPQELCSRCKTLGYYCRSNINYRCHLPQTPQLPPAREPPFPITPPKSWSNRQL